LFAPGRQRSDSLDLDQPFRSQQPLDDHEGARRRALGIDMLVTSLDDHRPGFRIDRRCAVVVQLDEILARRAGRSQGKLEVVEGLLHLPRKVAGPDKLPRCIARHLACDEDPSRIADLDEVRKPERGWK
jgi:hypothetical protein